MRALSPIQESGYKMTQVALIVALAMTSVTVNLELRVNLLLATSSTPKPLGVANKKTQERVERAKLMNFTQHHVTHTIARPAGNKAQKVVQYIKGVLPSGYKMTQVALIVALAMTSVTVNLELSITR